MKTVGETRLDRLGVLVKKHGGSLARLNEAIGLNRTDATLSQIRTRAPHSRTGKPRTMGDELARRIEQKLALPVGWMDTPLTYAEISGDDNPRARVMLAMEALPDDQWQTAVLMLNALIQSYRMRAPGSTGETQHVGLAPKTTPDVDARHGRVKAAG